MNSMFGIELPINELDAFKVKAFEANKWLLWAKPDSTWSWLLKPLADGQTRLILRIRAHPVNFFWTMFMEFGDPPMARRMLKGIKARCAVTPPQPPRSGSPAVLVEDSTQAVATHDRPNGQRYHIGRLTGPALVYPLMRPGVKVVIDELGQHPLQVAAAKDEQMVQHLPPY